MQTPPSSSRLSNDATVSCAVADDELNITAPTVVPLSYDRCTVETMNAGPSHSLFMGHVSGSCTLTWSHLNSNSLVTALIIALFVLQLWAHIKLRSRLTESPRVHKLQFLSRKLRMLSLFQANVPCDPDTAVRIGSFQQILRSTRDPPVRQQSVQIPG